MTGEPSQTKEQIDIPRFRTDADYRRQIREATQAEIDAERAARGLPAIERPYKPVRHSFRNACRYAFEDTRAAVSGKLHYLQWRLPRRYPRLAPLFDKLGL